MVHELDDARRELSQELLQVYEHALRQRELGAAEHVLRALEELARSDAGCQAALEQAYLLMGTAGHING
jgi:hypothetical protein